MDDTSICFEPVTIVPQHTLRYLSTLILLLWLILLLSIPALMSIIISSKAIYRAPFPCKRETLSPEESHLLDLNNHDGWRYILRNDYTWPIVDRMGVTWPSVEACFNTKIDDIKRNSSCGRSWTCTDIRSGIMMDCLQRKFSYHRSAKGASRRGSSPYEILHMTYPATIRYIQPTVSTYKDLDIGTMLTTIRDGNGTFDHTSIYIDVGGPRPVHMQPCGPRYSGNQPHAMMSDIRSVEGDVLSLYLLWSYYRLGVREMKGVIARSKVSSTQLDHTRDVAQYDDIKDVYRVFSTYMKDIEPISLTIHDLIYNLGWCTFCEVEEADENDMPYFPVKYFTDMFVGRRLYGNVYMLYLNMDEDVS